jgi:hypothetical protein
VSVFPNPTSEVLTVRASTTDWDYQVLDISGRMLLNGSAQQTEQRIQVNSLSTGIYKIVIRSESAFFSASFVKL